MKTRDLRLKGQPQFVLATANRPHLLILAWCFLSVAAGFAQNPYVVRTFVEDGKQIDEIIVPGRPPLIKAEAVLVPEPNPAAGISSLTTVPAFTWCYGCSATSAAMMMGYYDNHGYPNMYTGPANGGVCPVNNETYWGHTAYPSVTCGECPLSATHAGTDGRVERGHVDDYWIDYGNPGPDPYIVNSWPEHTQGDCTADFMGTSQSKYGLTDGGTLFYMYTDGTPLYDYTGSEPSRRDGCHGMKLFVNSRGYTVSANGNFSQYIYGYNGNVQGFTWDDFKSEIDAGRPVLIQVSGHTMLGYGYNDTGATNTGTTVYIHDTWDNSNHSMTWGGSYSGMQHYGVTVLRLEVGASAISVSPASQDFGYLQVNMTADRSFYVTNSGAGVLSGTASVAAPFSIVSGGTYNLIAGNWQAVVVRYTPVVRGTNTTSVTFTGGAGATRPVTGAAYAIQYVNVSNATPLAPYTSWATAATNIQDAVDVAAQGETVIVSNGVYNWGTRIAVVNGQNTANRLVVDKPITVRSVNGAALTTIDGMNAGRCVLLSSGATLDGFRIVNGFLAGEYNESCSGGGVRAVGATVKNCILESNSVSFCGGGILVRDGGIVRDSIVRNNSAYAGAGVQALAGGQVVNCTVSGNSSDGIYCQLSGSLARNCLVYSNSRGIVLDNGPLVESCTVVGNQLGIQPYWGGGELHNTIVWGNTQNCAESNLFMYCCTTPLPAGGTGNIANDPQFSNPAAANYRLSPESPCIDAGNNSYVVEPTDLDGNPRILGIVDMGAYEYPRLANDLCSGAIPLADLTVTMDTATASSAGDPVPSCQSSFGKGVWFSFTSVASGPVTISTCGSSFDTVLQVYSGNCGALTPVACNDDYGPLCAALQASVSFYADQGATYLILAGGRGGASGSLSIAAYGAANDVCSGAIPLTRGNTYTMSTASATAAGDPTPTCASNVGKTVWFSFVPGITGPAVVSLCGSSFDTVLQVYSGSCGSLVPIACNDDAGPSCSASQSSVRFDAVAGTPYLFLAGGFAGASGNLRIVVDYLPILAVSPASQDFGYIRAGTTADRSFYVTNSGGGILYGSAGSAAPFSIVSGRSYGLGAGAWQAVAVRYSPTAAGTNNSSITFSGGSGATRPVSGAAYTNRSPVALNASGATTQNQPLVTPVEKLLLFASDPDGDLLTVSAVSSYSTNGAPVALITNTVTYTPLSGYVGADRFTYTVSDGRGGTASAYVLIAVRSALAQSGNMLPLLPIAGGFQVRFLGLPSRTYVLQRADSTAGPWVSLATITTDARGFGSYDDTASPPGSAFYRTTCP